MSLIACIVPLRARLSKSFLRWSRLKYWGTVNKDKGSTQIAKQSGLRNATGGTIFNQIP